MKMFQIIATAFRLSTRASSSIMFEFDEMMWIRPEQKLTRWNVEFLKKCTKVKIEEGNTRLKSAWNSCLTNIPHVTGRD